MFSTIQRWVFLLVCDAAIFNTPELVSFGVNGRPKQEPRPLPAPNCQLLIKYNSNEQASPPLITMREALTYASPPFQFFWKLMGRALTLFWKIAVNVLTSNAPHHQTKVGTTIPNMNTDERKLLWTEMDVKEMFPEIPKPDIIPAFTGIHTQLVERKRQGPVEFYIQKDGNRKMDNPSHVSRDFFQQKNFLGHCTLHAL